MDRDQKAQQVDSATRSGGRRSNPLSRSPKSAPTTATAFAASNGATAVPAVTFDIDAAGMLARMPESGWHDKTQVHKSPLSRISSDAAAGPSRSRKNDVEKESKRSALDPYSSSDAYVNAKPSSVLLPKDLSNTTRPLVVANALADEEEETWTSSGSDQHTGRSQSFRSQTSYGTSQETHASTSRAEGLSKQSSAASSSRGRSDVSSNLARSASSGSTHPTSPEVEMSASIGSMGIVAAEAAHKGLTRPARSPARGDGGDIPARTSVVSPNDSFTSRSESDADTTRVRTSAGSTPIAIRPTGDADSRTFSPSTLSATSRLASSSSLTSQNDKGVMHPSESSSSIKSLTQTSKATLAHRNKPLPVPDELQMQSTLPSEVQLPVLEVATPGSDFSATADTEASSFVTAPREQSLALASSKSSLKSMLTKSGKLFRNASFIKESSSSLAPLSASSHFANLSDTSLHLQNSPSPGASQTQLSSVSHSSSGSAPGSGSAAAAAGVATQKAGRSKSFRTTPSSPEQRASSPMFFGLRPPSSLGGNANSSVRRRPRDASPSTGVASSSPLLQDTEEGRPPLSSTSSTSSFHSESSQARRNAALQKRPSFSSRLSQHFSGAFTPGFFAGAQIGTHTDTRQDSTASPIRQPGIDRNADTAAAAVAEASKKLQRPRLTRMRSRSVDDMARTMHPEAIKSLAIGTVSVVDVEEDAAVQQSAPSERTVVNDTVSPASELELEKTLQSSPAVNEETESAFSRLAGSLRRRATPANEVYMGPSPAKQDAEEGHVDSWKHRRHQSSGAPATPRRSSTQIFSRWSRKDGNFGWLMGPDSSSSSQKDPLSKDKDAWWDGEAVSNDVGIPPLQTEQKRTPTKSLTSENNQDSVDSTLERMEAAHIAAALSAGDETAIARLNLAAESPKSAKSPVPLPLPKERFADIKGRRASEPNTLVVRHSETLPPAVPSKLLESPTDFPNSSSATRVPSGARPRIGHVHKRSMSIGKMFEPLLANKVLTRNNTFASRATDLPDDENVSLSSHYESAISASTSFAGLESPDVSSRKARQGMAGITPDDVLAARGPVTASKHGPSAFKATRAQGQLPKSGSEPISLRNRGANPKGHEDAVPHERVPRPMNSQMSTPPRSSSIAARARKLSSPSRRSPAAVPTQKPRNSTPPSKNVRPNLSIDTKATTDDQLKREASHAQLMALQPRATPPRPSSALGMSAKLEIGAQRRSSLHHPTLTIADDKEFLNALEQVRKHNQDRIKKQQEEANKVERLARLGMAPGNRRIASATTTNPSDPVRLSPTLDRHAHTRARQTRSSSSDGRLGLIKNINDPSYEDLRGSLRINTSSTSSNGSPTEVRPSPLELGVGRASGKLRDGAFINDEDWKKEVKALFVIRELVLTERSYASHLEALLAAVRKIAATPSRRGTTTSLMLTTSSGGRQTHPVAPHILLMRNLLPQLITLSRTLANRIDENPTAAGVGAAFRLVSGQMEASFIAWSSAAQQIMDALRISEAPKSKSRNKIGLIGIEPPRHVLQGGAAVLTRPKAGHEESGRGRSRDTGFKSMPASPIGNRPALYERDAEDIEMPQLPPVFVESPTSLTFDDNAGVLTSGADRQSIDTESTTAFPPKRIAKRRGTLSALPPSITATLRSKTAQVSGISPSRANDERTEVKRRATGTDDEAKDEALSHLEFESSDPQYRPPSTTPRRSLTASVAQRALNRTMLLSSSSPALDLTTTSDGLSTSPSSGKTSGSATPSIVYGSKVSESLAANGGSGQQHLEPSATAKKLMAMDVAIMPTQRIPRYLLLLRDLHSNTPPQSLSHVRLQRSLDFIHRVALSCDSVSKSVYHKPASSR